MKLVVNILVGLPGSGKTTWLNNNFNQDTFFDELHIKDDALSDNDFEKLRELLYDDKVKEISISDVNFADPKKLYNSLNVLHNLISNTERKEEYNFILFQQPESYCVKSIKNRVGALNELDDIRRYAPVIENTFKHLKDTFPKYTKEVFLEALALAPVTVDELSLDPNEIIEKKEDKKTFFSMFRKKI